MGANRLIVIMAVAAVSLIVGGCGKKTAEAPVPHDNPPVFDPAKDQIGTWMVGKWCPGGSTPPEMAEQYGVDPASEVDVSQFWEFAADGTFSYGKLEYPGRITGTWIKNQDQSVSLEYKAWDGEPLNDRRARLAKEEESGAASAITAMMGFDNTVNMLRGLWYLEVSDDGKGLVFTEPGDPNASGDSGGVFEMMDTGSDLVRMK